MAKQEQQEGISPSLQPCRMWLVPRSMRSGTLMHGRTHCLGSPIYCEATSGLGSVDPESCRGGLLVLLPLPLYGKPVVSQFELCQGNSAISESGAERVPIS